jgi:hypothetical protein
VTLLVTNDRTIAAYNRFYLGKRGPTDVVSIMEKRFLSPKILDPLFDYGGRNLGDIVVSWSLFLAILFGLKSGGGGDVRSRSHTCNVKQSNKTAPFRSI